MSLHKKCEHPDCKAFAPVSEDDWGEQLALELRGQKLNHRRQTGAWGHLCDSCLTNLSVKVSELIREFGGTGK